MGKHGSSSYSMSRRAQLQRQLGDVGEVLDRVARGGGRFRAAGWYAAIGEKPETGSDDREVVYLGDHFPDACVAIAQLLEPEHA